MSTMTKNKELTLPPHGNQNGVEPFHPTNKAALDEAKLQYLSKLACEREIVTRAFTAEEQDAVV